MTEGRRESSLDMRIVRLGTALFGALQDVKPLVEDLLRDSPSPRKEQEEFAPDRVKCRECDSAVLLDEAIVVEVPREDKRFFDTALCLMRWSRKVV